MPAKKTQEQFIREASIKHNSKYDYSLVAYKNSHTKVEIICPIHGKFEQNPCNHLQGQECKRCGLEKKKQTSIAKYGVENPQQSQIVNKKTKQTNLERYGHENIAQGTKKEKIKQTNLEKYGIEHYTNRNKWKQTNLERYGVEYYTNREQAKQTNLERFGVSNPNHVKNYHMLDILPLIQNYNWLINQYINQNKTAIQIAIDLKISDVTLGRYLKYHEIEIKQNYWYSYKSISWLESIIETEQIYIQHALNGGEFLIPGTRLKADGFCSETNTIYEFHGNYWHGNPELYEANVLNESTNCTMGELYRKTLNREKEIKELGYNLVVMWENDYDTK